MRNFVKGFGEIKQDGIYLCLVIYSCYPVMDCLDELGLTREPWLETVLEVEYDVVFPHVAKDNVLHNFEMGL